MEESLQVLALASHSCHFCGNGSLLLFCLSETHLTTGWLDFSQDWFFFVAAQCKWNMSHISSDSLTDTATWDFVSQTQNMQAYAWLGIQNTKTKDALQLKRYVSIQSQRQWPSTLRFKTSFEIVRLFYTHNGYTSLKRLRSKHHCRAYSNSFRGFYYFIFYFPRLNYIAKWKSCDHWLLCKDVVIPRQMSPLS